jgi:hypothetical protein
MPGEDGECAVHLFRQNNACQLMRERDPTKREHHVGTLSGGVGPSVRRPNCED